MNKHFVFGILIVILMCGMNLRADENQAVELIGAAMRSDKDKVTELIKSGTDINGKNWDGQTALYWTAFEGKSDMAQFLIDQGADVNLSVTEDDVETTPLIVAAQQGHSNVVRVLLAEGASDTEVNGYGLTALGAAAWLGKTDVVKVFIELKKDLNIRASSKRTALGIATEKGHKEIVDLLKAAGASMELKDSEEKLPEVKVEKTEASVELKDEATVTKAETPVELTDEDYASFLLSARTGNDTGLKRIIKKGADVNFRDEEGNMALHYAVQKNKANIVKILLEAGADPNAVNQDYFKKFPLRIAAENGQDEITKLLLAKGANINQQDIIGYTALHVAAMNKKAGVVKQLINAGADLNLRTNEYKETPLILVSSLQNSQAVAELLIQAGADLDVKDATLQTALMHAVEEGEKEIVKLLVQAGAKTDGHYNNGQTPYERALSYGNTEIAKLLKTVKPYKGPMYENEQWKYRVAQIAPHRTFNNKKDLLMSSVDIEDDTEFTLSTRMLTIEIKDNPGIKEDKQRDFVQENTLAGQKRLDEFVQIEFLEENLKYEKDGIIGLGVKYRIGNDMNCINVIFFTPKYLYDVHVDQMGKDSFEELEQLILSFEFTEPEDVLAGDVGKIPMYENEEYQFKITKISDLEIEPLENIEGISISMEEPVMDGSSCVDVIASKRFQGDSLKNIHDMDKKDIQSRNPKYIEENVPCEISGIKGIYSKFQIDYESGNRRNGYMGAWMTQNRMYQIHVSTLFNLKTDDFYMVDEIVKTFELINPQQPERLHRKTEIFDKLDRDLERWVQPSDEELSKRILGEWVFHGFSTNARTFYSVDDLSAENAADLLSVKEGFAGSILITSLSDGLSGKTCQFADNGTGYINDQSCNWKIDSGKFYAETSQKPIHASELRVTDDLLLFEYPLEKKEDKMELYCVYHKKDVDDSKPDPTEEEAENKRQQRIKEHQERMNERKQSLKDL